MRAALAAKHCGLKAAQRSKCVVPRQFGWLNLSIWEIGLARQWARIENTHGHNGVGGLQE